MRKKTIGEVLRLARINQGLSLEDLQQKTDIQLDLLEALEADDFDKLPSSFYAKSFLRKYAWAVDLDEKIILDAYESGSMVTYDEVDVDEENMGRRRSNRQKTSYLPLFYFSVISLAIIAFVTYYVWQYVNQMETETENSASSSYSVVKSEGSSESASSSSNQTSSSSTTSSNSNALTVSGSGQNLTATYSGAKDPVTIKLSVTSATSWVSVSGTDLDNGVVLSPENPSVTTTVSPGLSTVITLGVVEGVTVSVNDQIINTSAINTQSGTITLTINN
ncbi:helix-turn-helix domain-containing protein [Streptococcus gordonii]|jgi:hypothetical protein|uniref:cytoskeleton protein RodZ n=1 Tax=Streptococcus gordonii TaxID=1302 RepID=UPI000E51926A|nr:cytoskeleton protein RodZ [Streptococcus gordonii]MCY7167764.1 helix-turn-helix domain-containing protein [Streptococcus gordonii]RHE65189.1 helix-turn-helix domain-containing protein [Streptococcus gordonii]